MPLRAQDLPTGHRIRGFLTELNGITQKYGLAFWVGGWDAETHIMETVNGSDTKYENLEWDEKLGEYTVTKRS